MEGLTHKFTKRLRERAEDLLPDRIQRELRARRFDAELSDARARSLVKLPRREEGVRIHLDGGDFRPPANR